jgi:8-hydroxy-5-deazaflavin:NADPH oxidoreductase
MKIGIVGSGDVAKSLGAGLVKAGHSVMLGTRDIHKKELGAWAKKKHDSKHLLGSTTDAAHYGEIIILAVAWHAAEDVLAQIRPQVSGKVVIDVTNPLVYEEGEPPRLSVGHSMSAGEIVQASLPDSHVVKTLNTINHKHMAFPEYKDGVPIMFVCGNNRSAKLATRDLLLDIGWIDLLDLGDIEKARLLEPLALLWIEYGVARSTWDHAVAMLTKNST